MEVLPPGLGVSGTHQSMLYLSPIGTLSTSMQAAPSPRELYHLKCKGADFNRPWWRDFQASPEKSLEHMCMLHSVVWTWEVRLPLWCRQSHRESSSFLSVNERTGRTSSPGLSQS